jgi:hypothetical protein
MFGFSLAGLLLGHAVSYILVIPDPDHRDLILRDTGHGYLPGFNKAAMILLLVAVATVLVRAWSWHARSRRRTDRPERFCTLAATLAAVQTGAFVGQEVLERLATGSPVGDLAHDHLLTTGILVQLTLALAGAAILWWLARASGRIAEAATAAGRSDTWARTSLVLALPTSTDRPHERIALGTPGVRAPPLG